MAKDMNGERMILSHIICDKAVENFGIMDGAKWE